MATAVALQYFYDPPSTPLRHSRYIYPSTKASDLRILIVGELLGQARFPGAENTFVCLRSIRYLQRLAHVLL